VITSLLSVGRSEHYPDVNEYVHVLPAYKILFKALFVTCPFRARTVQSKGKAIAREWLSKDASTARDTHARVKELLEAASCRR
jgi:hypothetical protein